MAVVSRRSHCCVLQPVSHVRTKSLGTTRKIDYVGGHFRYILVSVLAVLKG